MHSVRTGILMACCLVVTLSPPVSADPAPSAGDVADAREAVQDRSKALGAAGAQLAEAQARLESLASAAERLVESYNGELVRQAEAERSAEAAKRRLAEAEGRVEESREAVALIATQTYGSIDLTRPLVGLLAGDGGMEGFLHRASVLQQVGGEQGEILQRLRESEQISGILRAQSEAAYAEQRAASERAEKAKAAAQKAVARQTAETGRLEAEKKELQGRVDAARSLADRLARRRSEALEQARQERERKTAQAEAAASARAGSGSRGSPRAPVSSGSQMGDVAANWALTQLGKPYIWAADGPGSYDCSGLTMRAWERVGVRIDHWTGTQWTSGPHVPLSQLRRGDLLFFGHLSNDPGTIHHVGMYIGRGLMVHAPQTGDVVRIASMWRRDLVGATRPR